MDFNNDGMLDLVMGERLGLIHFFPRTSEDPITLGADSVIRMSNGDSLYVGQNSAPFVVDWNNDGLLDLIVCNEGHPEVSPKRVRLFINTGTPEAYLFETEDYISYDPGTGPVPIEMWRTQPCVFDLNNDGKKDLILGEGLSVNPQGFWYYENQGSDASPEFGAPEMLQREGGGDLLMIAPDTKPFLFDWNNDGVVDVLSGDYSDCVYYCLGVDNNGFEEESGQEYTPIRHRVGTLQNPASSSLSFFLSSGFPVQAEVSIISIDGRTVKKIWSGNAPQGLLECTADISELPQGVYLLKADFNGEISSTRVTVIR